VTTLSRLARTTYRARRYERAVREPGRFVRNRLIAKALAAAGFFSLMRRLWR
jgi:hypothetical protein